MNLASIFISWADANRSGSVEVVLLPCSLKSKPRSDYSEVALKVFLEFWVRSVLSSFTTWFFLTSWGKTETVFYLSS